MATSSSSGLEKFNSAMRFGISALQSRDDLAVRAALASVVSRGIGKKWCAIQGSNPDPYRVKVMLYH